MKPGCRLPGNAPAAALKANAARRDGLLHVKFASVGEMRSELVGCHDITVGQGAERIVHCTSRSSETHSRANGVGVEDLRRPGMSLTPAAPPPRDPNRRPAVRSRAGSASTTAAGLR